jgi:parallel beta-helix repeat protein
MGNAVAVKYIDHLPYEITEPGYYVLTVDGIDLTSDYGIKISADDVVLDGNGHVVDGVVIGEGHIGIYILGSNVTVKNLVVRNWWYGIYLDGSNDCKLINNTASNNWDYGIYLSESNNNTLIGNTLLDDGIFIYGYKLEDWYHTIDTSNTVNGKPVYYYRDKNGGTIPDNAGQIILVNCTDMIVENQNISNTDDGIELAFSSNISVRNNVLLNYNCGIILYESSDNVLANNTVFVYGIYGYGISLVASSNNTLANNTVSNNDMVSDDDRGIYLVYSSDNVLANNTVSNNWEDGICLEFSNDNVLTNNTVSNNWNGICLEFSNNNVLTNNTVSNNRWNGICLEFSNDNVLANNIVSNNRWNGIELYESSNLIYNNVFTNNVNVYEGTNIWNITKTPGKNIVGGNYLGGNAWLKPDGTGFSQTCNDTDGDGICDEPYIINENNIDYLPLKVKELPTNNPPVISLISPPNGATIYDTSVTLKWNGYDPDGDSVTYDLYFGNTPNPPLYKSNLKDNSYTVTVTPGTHYWKVVAKDEHGATTESDVWSFTISKQQLPKLHLEKRDGRWKLVDENDNVVVLRGVNIPDPYYLDHKDHKGKFNEDFFRGLHSMGVNVIRVPVHPIFWKKLGAEEYTTKYLDKIVEWAYKYKFYVILDWHAIGNPKFKGICYNPPGKTIDESLNTPEDKIKEDLLTIKDFTNRIRTYGVGKNLKLIPKIIHDDNLGLKVYLGVYINERDPVETQKQINESIRLAKNYSDVIEAIVVGNEVFTQGLVSSPDYLLEKINEIKKNVSGYGIKVTTAEVWQFWVKDEKYLKKLKEHSNIKPEDIENIINSVDFVLVHIHPFNDNVSIDNAMGYFKDVWENKLKDLRSKKQVVVGETGWPTGGNIRGGAVPSEENQARFLKEFLKYAHENNIDYFWCEAFDQPWKATKDRPDEAHWGLFDENRNLKKIHEGYNFTEYKPARLDFAKDFWSYISSRYKDKTYVIYDIYNEPALGITWNEWKQIAEELIHTIRQNDPDSLIIVGGIDFAYDLSGVKDNPIKVSNPETHDNITYAVHVYPNRPYDEWDSKWGKIADKYPVMLTEWGYDLNTKTEHLMGTRTYALRLMGYIGESGDMRYTYHRVIGWLAWCYDSDWEPNMLEKDEKLNDFGKFVEGVLSPIITEWVKIKVNGFEKINQPLVIPHDIIVIPANTNVDIIIDGTYVSTDGDTSSKKVTVYINGSKVYETTTKTGIEKPFKIELLNVKLPYGEHSLTIEIDNHTRHLVILSYISAINTSGNKFIITRDGYNFKNPTLTFEDLVFMYKIHIIRNIFPIPVGTFAEVTYALMASGGHCYGMSYTASLFHADLEKPPKRPVYSLSWKDVTDIVGAYHLMQLVDGTFLLKLKGAVFDNNNVIAENVKEIIGNKKIPVIVLYKKSGFKKDWHAVDAIGYVYTNDSIILVIYDNNEPGNCHILQVPYYLNVFHPEKKFAYYSAGSDWNLASVTDPFPYRDAPTQITYAAIKILEELVKRGLAITGIKCPVNINITDENGNQLLIINDTVVINTLNANVFIVNDSKTVILPANRTYTITLIGTGNGSVNITELTPVGNNITTLNVTFKVQNGSIVTIKTLNGSAMIKDVNIDYDNDGIIDKTLKPNVTANVSIQELKKLFAPVASFTYTPTNPTTADTIQFTDQSYDPDGTIVAWHWDFGDGTTSNAQNPTHRYTQAGTYTVTLTVTDNDGNTNSTSKTIVVRQASTTTTTTMTRHYYGGGGGAGGGGYVVYQTPKPTTTVTATVTTTATPTQTVTIQIPTTKTTPTPTQIPTETTVTTVVTTITTTAKKPIPGFTTILALIALSLATLTIKRKIR